MEEVSQGLIIYIFPPMVATLMFLDLHDDFSIAQHFHSKNWMKSSEMYSF